MQSIWPTVWAAVGAIGTVVAALVALATWADRDRALDPPAAPASQEQAAVAPQAAIAPVSPPVVPQAAPPSPSTQSSPSPQPAEPAATVSREPRYVGPAIAEISASNRDIVAPRPSAPPRPLEFPAEAEE